MTLWAGRIYVWKNEIQSDRKLSVYECKYRWLERLCLYFIVVQFERAVENCICNSEKELPLLSKWFSLSRIRGSVRWKNIRAGQAGYSVWDWNEINSFRSSYKQGSLYFGAPCGLKIGQKNFGGTIHEENFEMFQFLYPLRHSISYSFSTWNCSQKSCKKGK